MNYSNACAYLLHGQKQESILNKTNCSISFCSRGSDDDDVCWGVWYAVYLPGEYQSIRKALIWSFSCLASLVLVDLLQIDGLWFGRTLITTSVLASVTVFFYTQNRAEITRVIIGDRTPDRFIEEQVWIELDHLSVEHHEWFATFLFVCSLVFPTFVVTDASLHMRHLIQLL